jgi:hypothetical protein
MEDRYKQFLADRQGMRHSDKVSRERSVKFLIPSSAARTDYGPQRYRTIGLRVSGARCSMFSGEVFSLNGKWHHF